MNIKLILLPLPTNIFNKNFAKESAYLKIH